MIKVKITIGMPTYNRAEYLKTSIPLVLNQTFEDFEFIICDDSSTDDTFEVIKSFTDPRIKYFRNEKNLNIPGALNRILQLSKGNYIVILHDHDIFDPGLIEKMYDLLEKNPSVGFVHPGVAMINPDGSNRKELINNFPEVMNGMELTDKILFSDNFASPVCACGLVRRSAFEEVGFYYDPSFGFVSDVDLWLRLSMKFNVGYIKETVLTCRRRDENHEFYSVSWNLNKWLIELFEKNINLRFKDDRKSLKKALLILEKKKNKLFRDSLIGTVINKNLPAYNEGRIIIRSESKNLFNKILVALINSFSFSFFSRLFVSVNFFRKKILKWVFLKLI